MEGKHSEAVREGVQDYEYLRLLREVIGKRQTAGGDVTWRVRAEALLKDGVAEALKYVAASNQTWQVEKDRSSMDTIRIRALDLLETGSLPPLRLGDHQGDAKGTGSEAGR